MSARVLVAMSGGVDSSVAAALLLDQGYDVVGATMKLWGGSSDSGCCSVSDVEDARRVAQQLGIVHHVFNFTDDFDRHVVDHYVDAHARGRTPNPCIECNRRVKFDRFIHRAEQLGFGAVATGHHARVVAGAGGYELRRGVDDRKDQSYVLSMLGQRELARVVLPVGELTKSAVREIAAARGLRTAAKPDSQDVCFIMATAGGRETFLGDRIPLRPGRLVDRDGRDVGAVPAVELVTVGQRRGLGASGGSGDPLYALAVDVAGATVLVGPADELLVDAMTLEQITWASAPVASRTELLVQSSAHGRAIPATFDGRAELTFATPTRRVAPGQTVALYDGDRVVGAGIAT
jgi:tRNA-uridine 2-sulfurtransferase